MDALTYEELRAMAVAPSQPGAYSNSPLGENIGLHVHDGDADVDVVVGGSKVAEVYPDRTVVWSALYAQPVLDRLPDPKVRNR